jgi:TetR/AcrR family transcriptional repressor of mexJK operon
MILDSTAKRPARPPSPVRRQRFVDAARQAFFQNGYGATSMSEIAAAVGGSKTTLWTYFPGKDELFAAVCDDLAERYGCALTVELDPELPIEDQLRCFGKALIDTLNNADMVNLHRLVVGEAGRFPELARMFYERGPKRGKARLANLLAAAMDQGQIASGDPMLAAQQFVAMLQAQSWQWRLLGLVKSYSPAKRADELDTAVKSFLRCWSVDQGNDEAD